MSRLILAKTSRHGGDVRSEKSATAREGVPWGAARSLLGTVIDEEVPEKVDAGVGVEARDDDMRRWRHNPIYDRRKKK